MVWPRPDKTESAPPAAAIVIRLQMPVHGGNGIAHHAKGHFLIRLALMFNHHMQITGIALHLYGIEYVRAVPFQAFLNKTPRLKMQRVEVTQFA